MLIDRADLCIDDHVRPCVPGNAKIIGGTIRYVELLIVDEAEQLTTTALEWLRDIFDRRGVGLILIGMPGIEKGMACYPSFSAGWASLTSIASCRIASLRLC